MGLSNTLTNTSGFAITGPVYLVLDSLVAGAPLISAKDAAGASISVVLKFSNPNTLAISYTGRILSGGTVAP